MSIDPATGRPRGITPSPEVAATEGALRGVAAVAAGAALRVDALEAARKVIDIPEPRPPTPGGLRAWALDNAKRLFGVATAPDFDLGARALEIIGRAQQVGGDLPLHLPALAALRIVDEARVNGSPATRAALDNDAAVSAMADLRAAATGELTALMVERPDLVYASQTKGLFPTFLGIARFENTALMRDFCDLLFPINRVSKGPVEVLYRGAMIERTATQKLLAANGRSLAADATVPELDLAMVRDIKALEAGAKAPLKRFTSDVANLNVYFKDQALGTEKVLTMVVTGSQPRPNVAASALSMLDVVGDSIGESIEQKNQKLGRLLTENLIPELGIKIVDSPVIEAAKDRLADKLVAQFGQRLVELRLVGESFIGDFRVTKKRVDRDRLLLTVRDYTKGDRRLQDKWIDSMQLDDRERDLFRGGFGFTGEQLARIGASVDGATRKSGGTIAISPDNPSRAFVAHLQLDELLGAINAELGGGSAEVKAGEISLESFDEVLERGREILLMSIEQHMDVCYDLRALVPDFYRAWTTKLPLDHTTFAREQICRLPTSIDDLAREYYGHWASDADIHVEPARSYGLPGGEKSVTNHVYRIDRGPGEAPLPIEANVANLGNWQFDLPWVQVDGKVYVGLTPTLFNGEQARFTEVLKDNVALTTEKPQVHRAAVISKLAPNPYAYVAPSRPYLVQDVVRFRGRDVADLGLDARYTLDELVQALTLKYARQFKLLAADASPGELKPRSNEAAQELEAYADKMRALNDPKNYGVIHFKSVTNPELEQAMTAAGYASHTALELGTRASSVGEDAGLMSFKASGWKAPGGKLAKVNGVELLELGDVLADMNANPGLYDQSTQVLAMMLATKLQSPDGTTSYWNHVQRARAAADP